MHSDTNHRPLPSPVSTPAVLYLGPDRGLPPGLRPLLEHEGIGVLAGSEAGVPASPADLARCTLLILDTAVLGAGQGIAEHLGALCGPELRPPPLLVIAHAPGVEWRLRALQADAVGFFTARPGVTELAERVIALCRPGRAPARRVLVVDASPAQALIIEGILASAGFVVRTLCEARRVLSVAADFQPDLILMDLHVPLVGGAELVAITEDEDAPRLVPILLFSLEPGPGTRSGAARLDGGLCIAKPIRPDALVRAVSGRIEALRTLRRNLACADHLDSDTGLATRRHFISRLERLRQESDAGHPGRGVLVVALEGAARINESHGTGAATLVADRIGRLITERLTRADLAVRLDDHRHAVLVQRSGARTLAAFAEEFRATVAAAPIEVAGAAVTAGVSIGIGPFHPLPADAVALIARAEDACARALAAGGGWVLGDQPALSQVQETDQGALVAQVEGALRGPDRSNGFRLFFQPIVSVQRQGLHFVEVVLRLATAEGALIGAADVLSAVAAAGRLADLDRWVMLRALSVLKTECQAQPGLRLFVRQHVVILSEDGGLAWLRDQVLAHGLAQRRPIVELHQGDLLRHTQAAGSIVGRLRKIGIETCVADLNGTEVAVDLVSELRPSFVKLAADLVRGVKPTRLAELVGRFRRSGAQVIVAGVDEPSLLAPAWASGARFAQGEAIQGAQPRPVFDLGEVE